MHAISVRGIAPSLVLIAVVWYAIRVDFRRAAIYGLIAGVFEDILATGTGGAWTISTTLVALIAGMLSRGFFADSIPLAAAIVAVATLVHSLAFWLVMGIQGYPSGLGMLHFHHAIIQAIFNAAIMAVVTLIVRHVENRFA